MSFDDLKNIWDDQSPLQLSAGNQAISKTVKSLAEAMDNSGQRLYIISIAIGVGSVVWLGFWAYLFAHMGVEAMRAADIFPPLTLLVAPIYFITVCVIVIANHIQQKKMNKSYEDTLRGFALCALAQTRNRIRLLKLAPFALIGLWLMIVLSFLAYDELGLFTREGLPLVLAMIAGDIAIIATFFWWTRRRIAKRHNPRVAELEEVLAAL